MRMVGKKFRSKQEKSVRTRSFLTPKPPNGAHLWFKNAILCWVCLCFGCCALLFFCEFAFLPINARITILIGEALIKPSVLFPNKQEMGHLAALTRSHLIGNHPWGLTKEQTTETMDPSPKTKGLQLYPSQWNLELVGAATLPQEIVDNCVGNSAIVIKLEVRVHRTTANVLETCGSSMSAEV